MIFLKKTPYPALIGASVLMGVLPFSGESHLVEKLGMLMQGNLSKPIDIFDLFLHSFPMFLLVAKLILEQKAKKSVPRD